MPPTRRGRCRPATRLRPSHLLLAEDGVHHPAATHMRARLTQMDEELLVSAAGVFQCVGQDRQAVERSLVVDALGQFRDRAAVPGLPGTQLCQPLPATPLWGHGTEWVSEDVVK